VFVYDWKKVIFECDGILKIVVIFPCKYSVIVTFDYEKRAIR